MDSPVDYAGPAACGGPFARLTLNSPHNRNALSSTLVSQLHQGLSAAEADPAVRLVVLGHTGGTFCAGADLSEAGGGGGDPYRMAVARAREMTALLRAIVESPLPVVGAINGHVRAGGFGLVGACDMVVAGPESTFALTEARIGVAPAIISLTLLPKLSPRAAARYYLTGEKFGAREAADIGLITMAADDVDAAVAALVADVGRGSPQGLAASKALTTAAVLEGFDRDAERLTEESARLLSPTKRAKGCWPSCRNVRPAGSSRRRCGPLTRPAGPPPTTQEVGNSLFRITLRFGHTGGELPQTGNSMAKNNIAIPAAIIAWPMLPGNLDWVASCRRSMTNLHAQKTAATAKPTVPIQFTALNQMGDPLFGGMFIAVMSIAGIDPSGSVAYSVHERTGSKRGFMAAYIQAVASIIKP